MWKPLLLALVCAALLGCGGTPACTPTGFIFGVAPASSANLTPDHTQKAPGNQEQFQAAEGSETGPNCPVTALGRLVNAQWTVADPKNVSISSADDSTNGLATCLGTTNGAVTVTGSLTVAPFTETGTTAITCK